MLTAGGGTGGGGPALSRRRRDTRTRAAPAASGRLVIEDERLGHPGLSPARRSPRREASPAGFYRGVFDATRFQGGGIRPVAVSGLIDTGPFAPTYLTADQQYVPSVPAPGTPRQDFIAGIPPVSRNRATARTRRCSSRCRATSPTRTARRTSPRPPAGRASATSRDSGSQSFPIWTANVQPPAGDIAYANGILPGNTGNGISLINGREFLQFRITFYLNPTIGRVRRGSLHRSLDAQPAVRPVDFFARSARKGRVSGGGRGSPRPPSISDA